MFLEKRLQKYCINGLERALQRQKKSATILQIISRIVFGLKGKKMDSGECSEKRVRFKKKPKVHKVPVFPWHEFPPFSQKEVDQNMRMVRFEQIFEDAVEDVLEEHHSQEKIRRLSL
ncbi:hypothetical protein QR680_018499 [Steinernema hermaphroditum]|uniref:Uncharacterized protein n=1 Tax=Steinernema hermaphroditum TaxID=289476 RepID=A0AA39HJE2_9BILA|nr:hypothetical protein QR680_018499 [Steinernema hermaphroditum]